MEFSGYRIFTRNNCGMNALSLPVVYPAFQNLKRSGWLFHFAAASLILVHAVSHFNQPHTSSVYLGCLLIISLDIFILLFAGKNLLKEMPRVNLFFRFVEIIFFLGIGVTMLIDTRWITGGTHILLAIAYTYLVYCEMKVHREECIGIHHTGISIPALPDSKFFNWARINHVDARYDSITINTSTTKTYHFYLSRNLQFEELDQIHEFCR